MILMSNSFSVKSNESPNNHYLFTFFFKKIFNFIRSEIFTDETEYPRLFVLNTNPMRLSKIAMKWTRGLNIIATKMNVESIKVTALSYKRFVLFK